eukprot:gene12258-16437_t
MEKMIDQLFVNLPVNLSIIVDISVKSPYALVQDNTLLILIQSLLNENDIRISDQDTKIAVLFIISSLAKFSHNFKIRMRILLQKIHTGWFDELANENKFFNRFEHIIEPTIRTFARCWRNDPTLVEEIIKTPNITVQSAKIILIQHYATTQFQSLVRGFLGRKYVADMLHKSANERLREVQQWSILLIQKTARGYIARKTFLRSMLIRKSLSKEVLRITEKYLKVGDLWGFLKEMNEELNRAKYELSEHEQREDNWATNFVSKVIDQRQKEFNSAWEKFPKALQQFTATKKNPSLFTGSLLNMDVNSNEAKLMNMSTSSLSISPGKKSQTVSRPNTTLPFPSPKSLTINSPMNKLNTLNLSPQSQHSSTASFNSTGKSSSRQFSNHDVVAVPPDNSLPGPLIRKAIQTTVTSEISKELERLVNGQYRSNQLVNDIKSVYGPESNPQLMKQRQQKAKNNNNSNNNKKKNNTHSITLKLTPLEINKEIRSKKKKVGLDGKIIEFKGKVEAFQSDWVMNQTIQNNDNISIDENSNTSEITNHSMNFNIVVQPGNSLLLDIPLGFEDSMERFMHAAALRCYVPEFFRGVDNIDVDDNNDSHYLDDVIKDVDSHSYDEDDISSLIEKRKKQIILQKEKNNINYNPEYAYSIYLKMPIGLAKMKYEMDCKRWSQGSINKLKLKGVQFVSDAQPISKMVMLLKSVDTPRLLINKCVDLFVELKNMGRIAMGTRDKSAENEISNNLKKSSHFGNSNDLPNRNKINNETKELKSSEVSNSTRVDSNNVNTLDIKNNSNISITNNNYNVNNNNSENHNSNNNMKIQNSILISPLKEKTMKSDHVKFAMDQKNYEFHTHNQTLSDDNNASIVHNNNNNNNNNSQSSSSSLKNNKEVAEYPSKLLLSLVEDDGVWCSMNASIEDLFLHAAFLIVPYQKKTENHNSNKNKLKTEKSIGNHENEKMSNVEFKEFMRELLLLESEDDKREYIKERFRASFILATPYCLHLKKYNINNVYDLINSKFKLSTLNMQLPFETQIETLLTTIIGKAVDSKILPTVRDHLSTAEDLFMVPMIYDPKFQRSPFDPFGKPPRLQKKVNLNKNSNSHNSSNNNKINNNMKKSNNIHGISYNRKLNDKLLSSLEIEIDLTQQISMWGPTSSTTTINNEDRENDEGGDDDNEDKQWTFNTDKNDSIDEELLFQYKKNNISSSLKNNILQGSRNGISRGGLMSRNNILSRGSIGRQSMNDNDHNNNDNNNVDDNIKQNHINQLSRSASRPSVFSSSSSLTNSINDKIFTNSYKCNYPHCHQVFSRLYTYKVHLKSHELNNRYHDYKRNPQLILDNDRTEWNKIAKNYVEQKMILPPLIQNELNSLSEYGQFTLQSNNDS